MSETHLEDLTDRIKPRTASNLLLWFVIGFVVIFVIWAAVTELDQHAGKAGVIVALQITVTPPKGEPTIKKTRLVGQLTRTSTGWKLSALAQAPVGASG